MKAIVVGLVVLVTAPGVGSTEAARDATVSVDAARMWEVTAKIAAASHRTAIESFSLVTDRVTDRRPAPSSCR